MTSKELFEISAMEAYQAHVEKQENDIALMVMAFESANSNWKSLEEMDAWYAQSAINLAKQKIKELQEEIRKQEAIINCSETTVQNFKKVARAEKTNSRSRPKRSEFKERIAKKFTAQWVASLKSALGVESCGKLEDLVSLPTEESLTSERNWRRWLNGDAIPTYTTFEKLLSAKITGGKYADKTIYDIPIPLDHNSILTLLRFI
ncbi:MAG: hypothetical protein WC009_07905 [Methylotenera sp.]